VGDNRDRNTFLDTGGWDSGVTLPPPPCWWEGQEGTNLLDVSVGGLPHVVVFNDAGERLPGELEQERLSCREGMELLLRQAVEEGGGDGAGLGRQGWVPTTGGHESGPSSSGWNREPRGNVV
jgi:hypothetical protein